MPRTLKNHIYNATVKSHTGDIIHNKDYHKLQDIATDLGITNAMVYELSRNKPPQKYTKYVYYPKINITKIHKIVKSSVYGDIPPVV